VLAFKPRDFNIEAQDVLGLRNLGQTDDVGSTAHDGREIVHAVAGQRIDAHAHHVTGLAPGAEHLGRKCARLGAQSRRGEVLQLLDQHVSATRRRSLHQRGLIGAIDEQP
jgi:hypothetical protein